ncbi:hypothetical protein D3C84_1179430 [compost metagenome]
MIGGVHCDGCRIVVDGFLDAPADRNFDASAGATAAREVVDEDLVSAVSRAVEGEARYLAVIFPNGLPAGK